MYPKPLGHKPSRTSLLRALDRLLELGLISAEMRDGLASGVDRLLPIPVVSRRPPDIDPATWELALRWLNGMKSRCYNKKIPGYKNYGARGIYICDRWLKSREAFIRDMGPRPSPKHSIDRIDNDGPYSPENCRWATQSQQQTNRRHKCRLITAGGKTMALREWAVATGIRRAALYGRLRAGWTPEQVVGLEDRK